MTVLKWSDGHNAGEEVEPAEPGSRLARAVRAARRPWDAVVSAPRRPTVVAAVVGAGLLIAYFLLRHLLKVSMVDMIVYRAEGTAVADHHNLYNLRVTQWDLPATYPPFAALFFTPTAWVSVSVLRVFVTAANVVLLGLFSFLSFVLAGRPRPELRPAAVLLATGIGVWMEPIWTTFRYGQINLIIGCLVLWDLTRKDSWRGKGVAIGIAAGLKLTPALFVVWLLLTGRIRAACTAAATGIGTVLVGWLLLPGASAQFWFKDVFDTSRVGKVWIVDNQSVRGAVARLLHTTDPGLAGTAAAGLCGVLGLAVAVAWSRSAPRLRDGRGEAWGGLSCAVTALLVSPISWSHHWVWVLPMAVLLLAEAAREQAAPGHLRRLRWRPTALLVVLACCSFCLWIVPRKGDRDIHLPLWQQVFTDVYPLIGIAFLVLSAVVLRRTLRRANGEGAGVAAGAGDRGPEGVALPRPRERDRAGAFGLAGGGARQTSNEPSS